MDMRMPRAAGEYQALPGHYLPVKELQYLS